MQISDAKTEGFEAPVTLPANYTRLSSTKCIVRTQAGLRKALKVQERVSESTIEIRAAPIPYPAVLTFTEHYRGYHYVHVSVISLNKYYENLHKELKALEELDPHLKTLPLKGRTNAKV